MERGDHARGVAGRQSTPESGGAPGASASSGAGGEGGEQDRLLSLLRQTPALIAIFRGPTHIFEFVNPLYLQAVGRSQPEDLLGKPISQALPELEGQSLIDLLDQVYASGEPYFGNEWPVGLDRHGDGEIEESFFDFVWQPIKNAAGEVDSILAHAVDVTEQVKARRNLVDLAASLTIERQRLELAQEAAHLGTFDWNVSSNEIVWSEALEGLYGLPPGGFGGSLSDWLAAIHPEDRERALAEAVSAIRDGKDLRTEFQVVRPDGTIHWMEVRARVVLSAQGEPERLVGINLDVTDRKRDETMLREQTETLATVNRIGRLLTSELDQHRLVQAVTDAATVLIGAQFGAFFYNVIDEREETHMLHALSGMYKERFAEFPIPRSTQIFRPTFRGEAILRLDDVTQDPRFGNNPPYNGLPAGHPQVRSYLAVPVVSRWGKVLGGLFFGHEEVGLFTERHESLIVGLAAQTAIAMDNARMYQEAQESIRVRDEFLSSAAHDLKTPLAGIKGLAQLLLRRAGRMESEEAARLIDGLENIDRTATRMTALVNDLLDITRLHLGRPLDLDRTTTDLVPLARHAVKAAQSTTDRHRVVLKVDAAQVVGVWDGHRVGRVLDNLLNNAVRYSPEGGTIAVRVATEPVAGGAEALISVQDHGIGIPAGELEQVFDRFHRGSNVVGEIEGTGIGLASARYIIENHGGRITVESHEGQGSTFTIHLPITPVKTEVPSPTHP